MIKRGEKQVKRSDGTVYDSITSAAKDNNSDRPKLAYAIKKKIPLNGYMWEKLDCIYEKITDTTRVCTFCLIEKPWEEFHKNKHNGRPKSICKICTNNKTSNFYHDNKETIKKQYKNKYKEDPDKYKNRSKRNRKENPEQWLNRALKTKYGISLEEYNKKLLDQNYKCSICSTPRSEKNSEKRFAVDHCHETGKVRGLLCNNCNTMLGQAKDSIEILKLAIIYLEKHK